MSKLRRYHTPGNWYFITCVTYQRTPELVRHADLMLCAFARARESSPHELHSWVLLPDHFHAVIDTQDSHISSIMQRIKMSFAAKWRQRNGISTGRIWQNRFWDHIIRDEDDLRHHVDYIHYNAVKHGYVTSPFDWPHSTLKQFYQNVIYELDWGARETPTFDGEYGE